MKMQFRTWLRGASVGLLLGGLTLFAGGCAFHEGVAYESSPYGPYYDYYYYPDWDVYFYPEGGLYYWHDDGRWDSGRRLPPHYELNESHRQYFRFHTRQPWTERGEHHEEHEEHEEHEHGRR